jgi:hypothetical protein
MATGEAALFKEIWDELEPNERVSFVNGHSLEDQHEMRTYYFAHILGKGKCPEFRLKKENIKLMSWDQHKLWDTKRWVIRENEHLMEMWRHVFELEEKLEKEYYGQL